MYIEVYILVRPCRSSQAAALARGRRGSGLIHVPTACDKSFCSSGFGALRAARTTFGEDPRLVAYQCRKGRRSCGKSKGGVCSYAEFRGVIGSYFPHLAARIHRVFSDLGSKIGRAHNPKVAGSNPAPATTFICGPPDALARAVSIPATMKRASSSSTLTRMSPSSDRSSARAFETSTDSSESARFSTSRQ